MKALRKEPLRDRSHGHAQMRAHAGPLPVEVSGGVLAPPPSAAVSDLTRVMTDEEAWAVVDSAARDNLGISGEDFLRRWDAGEYPDPDAEGVRNVVMYLGLVRPRA